MHARPLRLFALAAVLGAAPAWIAGCTAPRPFAPPVPSSISFSGRSVSWTTLTPALGAVRWGKRTGSLDHIAYPSGVDREDRAAETSHHVALLDLAAGDSVIYQVLERASDGRLTTSSLLATRADAPTRTPPLMTWTMIDVGFGDSHLLTMPTSGERVLIDSGERRDADNVDRYLDDSGVRRLDVAMATHIHEDHIGGYVGEHSVPDDGVLAHVAVGRFLEGGHPSAVRTAHEELIAMLAGRAIPRVQLDPGATDASEPALAWDPFVRVAVLNAGSGQSAGGETESDWINNDSIVLRLTYGNVSVVMGGDAEAPVQTRLLASGAPLQASVLKVHHHGLYDSSEPAYLDAVNPRVAMIPIVTYESFNGTLPSGIVLDRLRQRLIDVYANDRAEPLGLQLSGDAGVNVTLATNGDSFEIRVTPSRSHHYPGSSEYAPGAPARPASLTHARKGAPS